MKFTSEVNNKQLNDSQDEGCIIRMGPEMRINDLESDSDPECEASETASLSLSRRGSNKRQHSLTKAIQIPNLDKLD